MACQTENKGNYDEDEDKEVEQPAALDEADIQLLKSYGNGPYSISIKKLEIRIMVTRCRTIRMTL